MANYKMGEFACQKYIPVAMTNQAVFDDDYLTMKERFNTEMKKIDQEITRFSTNLMNLYGLAQSDYSLCNSASMNSQVCNEDDVINNCPLVEGEGENKNLKLQFDLSQFDPAEVKVTILDDILMVEATHIEKTPSVTIYREYAREVQLPKGLDPDAIYSNLSRDGVLTVQASLNNPNKDSKQECSEMATVTTDCGD